MTLFVIIVWLVVKTRRIKMFQRRDETITVTDQCFPPVAIADSFDCSQYQHDGDENDTPPPSYSSAVGSRCVRTHFTHSIVKLALNNLTFRIGLWRVNALG
jgi:hypothetical protein